MLAAARKLIAEIGPRYTVVARQLGVSRNWLRRRLDPEWREAENARMRARTGHYVSAARVPARHITQAEAKAIIAAVPPDTRDLTGRIFGDPLSGRSALDKLRAEGRAI